MNVKLFWKNAKKFRPLLRIVFPVMWIELKRGIVNHGVVYEHISPEAIERDIGRIVFTKWRLVEFDDCNRESKTRRIIKGREVRRVVSRSYVIYWHLEQHKPYSHSTPLGSDETVGEVVNGIYESGAIVDAIVLETQVERTVNPHKRGTKKTPKMLEEASRGRYRKTVKTSFTISLPPKTRLMKSAVE